MRVGFQHVLPYTLVSAGLALCTAAGAVAAAPGPPAPGRYAARLCVQPLADAAKPADCGPAELTVQRGNKARLRISDIVYRLELYSSQVDVVLMHGTMQIDGFTASYDWQGDTLLFSDREKGLRYQVQVGAPEAPGR